MTLSQGAGLALFLYSEAVAGYFDWEQHNVTVWAGIIVGLTSPGKRLLKGDDG